MRKSEFFAEARRDLSGPLAGLRVLEATTTWAGPMCGCMLADAGADVIKVEHPLGEISRRSPPFLPGTDPPISFMHATVNRNKRSLALDLRQERGRDLFLDLARRSDVVIQNFRPGTMDSWGIGYDAIRQVKPDVVYVSISGFGLYGPDHDQVGYDPLAQALSGFLDLNGMPEGPSSKSPTFLADDLAGLHGAFAVLTALRHRDQTGEGQHVDISLLDSLLSQSNGYLTLGALGVPMERLGNEFRIAAPANSYDCRDGRILAGVLLDSHWKRLTVVLGHPELGEHPDYATAAARIGRRRDVDALLAGWAQEHTVAEAVALLNEASIPVAPIRSYAEAAADPHVRERDMLQDVEQPDGTTVPLTAPAAKLSRTPLRIRRAAPALGADSDSVLEELGLGPAERQGLVDAGIVGRAESSESDADSD
jgi:formyl-CoA transferase